MAANFLDDLKAFVMKGGGGALGTGMAGGGAGAGATGASQTGPGVTPSGVRTPAPRNFVAPPGSAPMAPVGRPAVSGASGYATLPAIAPPTAAGVGAGAPAMGAGAAAASPSVVPSPVVSGMDGAGPEGAPAVAPAADPFGGLGVPGADGNVQLTPEGKQAFADRVTQARAAFGPYPGANDPTIPPPPLTPGKMFFNPFTGTYGRA